MPRPTKNKFAKGPLIALLQQLKQEHEDQGRSETALGIVQLIADINANRRDASEVELQSRITLKKYNGPKLPASIPVEIQEFITNV